MDPSSPLAQSLAYHGEMEGMREFEQEERRRSLEARLRLLQGKSVWQEEDDTTPADPSSWGNANDDTREPPLKQSARDEPDVGV